MRAWTFCAAFGKPCGAGPITTTAPSVGGIDVALESTVVLSGTIGDDASAQPLQGAGVQAFTDAGILAANALADAGGNFVLRGLLPGSLRLRALSPLFNENVPGVELQQVSRHVNEWHPDQAQFETAQRITVTAATQAPVPLGLKLGAVITGNFGRVCSRPDKTECVWAARSFIAIPTAQ